MLDTTISNSLQLFQNAGFKVRVVMHAGDPWFVAKDVASCIEYKDVTTMCRMCREKDVLTINGKEYPADLAEYSESRGNPNIRVISESGLYRILAKCKLPKCEPFESWVFDEVLPSIRKTGSYSVKQKDSYMIEDPVERAKAWIAEQEAHKAQLALKDEQINTLEIDNHNKDILIDGNYRTIKLITDEVETLDIAHYARRTLEGKVRSACKREAKVLGKPLQERITVVDDQERKTYLVPNEVYRLVMDRVKNDKLYLKRMK